MKSRKKVGGRDFVKGHHIGRPKLPDDVKEMRRLNTATFTEITNELIFMTRAQLRQRMKDPKTIVLEVLIGKTIEKGIATSNLNLIASILDRLVDRKAAIEDIPRCAPTVILSLEGNTSRHRSLAEDENAVH